MTDATLVELTLLGNGDAYGELVTRHQKAVLNTALAVTSNHYTAEDAAQDAFVTAWTKLSQLSDRSNYRAWVCAIARNRARRLAERYRDYIQYEELENTLGEYDSAVEDGFELELLRDAVRRLSDKIRRVIDLFYFQGLSLAEIAARESISVAAVKTRLHDGRLKLRKEMGYMSNEFETIPEAVARRLEEIKKWKYKNEKKGFQPDYESLLAELRALPETQAKYHALADLLRMAVWWIDGKDQNEKLMKELEEAAYKGNNQAVIQYLIRQEENNLSGKELAEFMLNTQIPKFESLSMTEAVGEEWVWLSYVYAYCREWENARTAMRKAADILSKTNVYYAAALSGLETYERLGTLLERPERYWFHVRGLSLERHEGQLLTGGVSFVEGDIQHDYDSPFLLIGIVDSVLLDRNLKKGETYYGSHAGDEITYVSDDATVTACGKIIDHCSEYRIKSRKNMRGGAVWYKQGIGLIAVEYTDLTGAAYDKRCTWRFELRECNVTGDGLVPLNLGNKWCYELVSGRKKEGLERACELEVVGSDGNMSYLKSVQYAAQRTYGETWEDAVNELSDASVCLSFDQNGTGVTPIVIPGLLEQVSARAKTEWQRAYTARLTAFINELLSCDPAFSPDSKEAVGWGRFIECPLFETDGRISALQRLRFWRWAPKDWTYSAWLGDLYGILQDRMGALWRSGWVSDVRFDHEIPNNWMNGVDLRVTGAFHYAGSIDVKAGVFENCMVLSTQVTGGIRNSGYRLHDADYYFADGVGLIKVITHCSGFLGDVVYELTEYSGTGNGFFPTEPGLERRYACMNSHAGFESSVTYLFAENDNGEKYMLFSGIGKHDKEIAEREAR